jgi:arginase family enzyme
LRQQLLEAGVTVSDAGDVPLAQPLPRHHIPPIRHWPAPRLVWEASRAQALQALAEGAKLLALGGDCSIIVGVLQALVDHMGGAVHVISVDGHVDAEEPAADRCVGAGAMGLWVATHASPFWPGPALTRDRITVIGCTRQFNAQIPTLSLADVRRLGVEAAVDHVLAQVGAASILVHFDVDALAEKEMPGAYDSSEEGFTIEEARTLLSRLLADQRFRVLEVTEYCPANDEDGEGATKLVELLAHACAAAH